MRIIGGRLRGKKLEWVSDGTTRPTTDRVKENIFNILSHSVMGQTLTGQKGGCGGERPTFENIKVLLLFAGTGQMGLECLSRGTNPKNIIFNDADENARAIITKNAHNCGFEPNIYPFDYMATLGKLKNQKFDLVFLDPPFRDLSAVPNATRYLYDNKMLNDNATIVVESETGSNFKFENFTADIRVYGRKEIYFLRQILL